MKNRRNIVFAAAAIVYLVFVILFWSYSIDDAFVTFRYAENLANGHGLTFNIGDKPAEGYSNFLWLLLLSFAHLAGLPTYLMAKLLGIAFILLSAWVWFRFLSKSSSEYLWLAPILFLVTPITAFWAVSGLEIGLYALILAELAITIIRKSYWSLLFVPMIVLVRPEGVAIGFVIIMSGWLADGISAGKGRHFYLSNLGLLILTMALLIMLRLSVFGYPMPNTYYVKSTLAIHGLAQLAKGLLFFLPLTLLFLFGLFRFVREWKIDKDVLIYCSAFLSMALINCLADAVMNFHLRYMLAFLPFFMIVALWALSSVSGRRLRYFVLIIAFLSLISPIASVFHSVNQEKRIMAAQMNLIEYINQQPAETRISLTDIGRIPYYTRAKYYDLWGLVSEDIGHKGFDAVREFKRFPDYFVFVGYMWGDRPILRFGRERMILKGKGFPHIYQLAAAGKPKEVSIQSEGYYYLVYRKNQLAIDSLLRLGYE